MLEILVGLAAACLFLDWISMRLRGDCDLHLDTQNIQNLHKTPEKGGMLLSFDVPLVNRSSKEQALVIYGSAELVPYNKEARSSDTWVRMTLAGAPRKDGYFESTLVKPRKSVLLRIEILIDGDGDSPKGTVPIAVEVTLRYYGRKPMAAESFRFSVPINLFQDAPVKNSEIVAPKTPKQSNVFPIPTHLIMPHEDLAEIIRKYTAGKFKPGDWVAIAESVVAIAQGRVYPVDSIEPGFWARRLNRFFSFDSSMASPYSMECAIREVGLARILAAVLVGLFGRLLGRSGDFYRIAGRDVATIDDCTGTLPPFDKSVVMGPKDANRVAEKISKKTGYEVAIVDANDLGKVDILGKSNGIIESELIEALRDNPQGNADEQTPIVMIKKAL